MRALIPFLPTLLLASALRAQDSTTARSDSVAHRDSARRDSIRTLTPVTVTAARADEASVGAIQRVTLAATAGVTARKAELTTNVVDPQDAVKYLPSLYLRKRNNGDTQATLATRVWGVGSSARSLVFADGVPLTALVANNNTIGGPRWGLVSPEEIARVDVMFGPFSAAYAGNSMGAVMEITTRLPERREGSVTQTQAVQRFDLYGTRRTLPTTQTNATLGERFGKLALWASGSFQDSRSQPLAYVTGAATPSGTTGGYTETNKLGAPADVLGATGLLHTRMTNAKLKLAWDLAPTLRAAYTLGLWANDASSATDPYLERSGARSYGGQAGFATGTSDLAQRHTAHSLTLRSDTRRDWDVELVATRYGFDRDRQRFPTTATAADTLGSAGRIAVLDGTGWTTLDVKGAWHAGGGGARHVVTFGVHEDRYRLDNPTYGTAEWRQGAPGAVATSGEGRTRTRAAWAQDRWRLTPSLHLTLGGRYEWWRASDGENRNGGTTVTQPAVDAARFSPKGILRWTPGTPWSLTASVAKAYRFATPAELYQLVSTGQTFTSPAPDLKPDDVLAAELRAEGRFARGFVQASMFQDDVRDAIISQFRPLVESSSTLYAYLANVDHVRARGIETVVGTNDVLLRGLDLSASATYLDARTLALSGRASASAPEGTAIGKFLPNIPRWRATVSGTYQPGDRLAVSLAGRYSGRLFTTLDNADVNFNTWQGFGEWFVMDTRAHYRIGAHWSAALGVDNVLNRKYFLFHPFPQRTLVASVKYAY